MDMLDPQLLYQEKNHQQVNYVNHKTVQNVFAYKIFSHMKMRQVTNHMTYYTRGRQKHKLLQQLVHITSLFVCIRKTGCLGSWISCLQDWFACQPSH